MKKALMIAGAAALIALSACGAKPRDLQGYAEADYLYLSPREPGYIKTLGVKEGDVVAAGAAMFVMDTARAEAALSKAQASAAASGGSTAATAQQIASARANEALARVTLERTHALYKQDFVSKAQLDQDQAAYDAAHAATRAAEAQTGAAGDQTAAAKADVTLAKTQMSDRAVAAPAAGRVERVFRRPGEFAQAGDPVIALLPPENMKVRFFAPEPMLAQAAGWPVVRVSCDGCGGPIEARMTFVASEPQFTPPVIYSLEQREKLVFLIEARLLRHRRASRSAPASRWMCALTS